MDKSEKSFGWGYAILDDCDGSITCKDGDGKILGVIVSDDVMRDWQAILDGADPIKDGWEDGAGHTCVSEGW